MYVVNNSIYVLRFVQGFDSTSIWNLILRRQNCKVKNKVLNKCSLCLLSTKQLFSFCTLLVVFLSFCVFWFLIFWLLLLELFIFILHTDSVSADEDTRVLIFQIKLEDVMFGCLSERDNLAGWEFFSQLTCFYWHWEHDQTLSMNKRLWKDLEISACIHICISFGSALRWHLFTRKIQLDFTPKT